MIKTLPETFTERGFNYTQERRSDHCAIYKQQWGADGSIAFEVVIPQIRTKTYGKNGWETCAPYEGYPSAGQWGEQGWTFTELDRAVNRYQEINEKASQTPDIVHRNRREPKRA